ncbi:Pnap_2097 family protein [Mangrovicoccus sp. HB161399]|uniref:Pnap_2097 family protein n=1 Tax=Mangrovicoccus sp. HB161399 TaxID=2720392 RepID=UPI0015562677|nr:Pnap_2097 family protein [Mangrovicoccus sp. HB161399]
MTAALRLASAADAPEVRDLIRLGMAQLSPWGLSEQWLLREAGDRHWALIAGCLGQDGTAFRDAGGRPVYAAFCATSLQLVPAPGLLGEEAQIRSRLFSLGPNRLGSVHSLRGPAGRIGRIAMVSCFLRHDATGSNRRLLRSALPGLAEVPPAPPELQALNARARGMARAARGGGESSAPLLRYAPVPALDFNAAGLLYFPTFSKIAELAAPSAGPPATRDIAYLGNLDIGETVTATCKGGLLILGTGDGGAIAAIRSAGA